MGDLRTFPRLVIGGMSGSSGKTIVSLGLMHLLRRAGVEVRAFKKGPDYIDAAWLAWASSHTARNLDTFLMGPERVVESFIHHATSSGMNVIEGNRGLFDGYDAAGTHSTAALARCLSAPVLLVVNASKVTRTAAAFVLGCQKLDLSLAIRGVILNNVSGERHRDVTRDAIESACGIPVVGCLPQVKSGLLPERHLGLVPPQEHFTTEKLGQDLLQLAEGRLDVDATLSIGRDAPPLPWIQEPSPTPPTTSTVTIGYLKDAAFTFYYPDNLETLEQSGASLVPVSALDATALPENLQALYIGGGFPETHARALAGNTPFLQSLRNAALRGLPIYAECGGLILLARNLLWKGDRYPMAAVFPFDVGVCDSPQGHGYSELRVVAPNPFFPTGMTLRGHEFHYSRIVPCAETISTACLVERGTGCFDKREFVMTNNVVATYTHMHAVGTPEWAAGMVNAARSFAPPRDSRN
ncbi:MAG: cobyrinate a,c-diamide synthase [Candidatus Sulfotelmatobacter sp.]|jgi:cobyrinic acid a,c-diamide synthase